MNCERINSYFRRSKNGLDCQFTARVLNCISIKSFCSYFREHKIRVCNFNKIIWFSSTLNNNWKKVLKCYSPITITNPSEHRTKKNQSMNFIVFKCDALHHRTIRIEHKNISLKRTITSNIAMIIIKWKTSIFQNLLLNCSTWIIRCVNWYWEKVVFLQIIIKLALRCENFNNKKLTF